jgi:O-methyltransferase involved in polyketide biosynthesis
MSALKRPRTAIVALTCLATALFTLLWLAGEQHRANCLIADRVACSVLPWQEGHARPRRTTEVLYSCINADRVERATGQRPPCR